MSFSDEIKVCKASFNDLEEILAIQKTAFLSEAELYNDYGIDALVQSIESIQADFEEYTFFKATLNDEIVGSVKGRKTEEYCWVGRLIVKPAYQNRGIAKKLMAALEKEFCDVAYYLLFTGGKSVKNIQLYESIGYKIADQYADGKNPDLILVKMKKENLPQ